MTSPEPRIVPPLDELLDQPGICASCRYWSIDNLVASIGDLAECRRNPPIRSQAPLYHGRGAKGDGSWPLTWAEDWCGEWQMRPPVPLQPH